MRTGCFLVSTGQNAVHQNNAPIGRSLNYACVNWLDLRKSRLTSHLIGEMQIECTALLLWSCQICGHAAKAVTHIYVWIKRFDQDVASWNIFLWRIKQTHESSFISLLPTRMFTVACPSADVSVSLQFTVLLYNWLIFGI